MNRYKVTVRLGAPVIYGYPIRTSLPTYAVDPDEACSEGAILARVLWPGFTPEVVKVELEEVLG